MRGLKTFLVLGAGAGLLFTAACDQYHESYVTPNRVQVQHERYTMEVPAVEADEAFYKGLAREYLRYGGDGLYLSFVYDPSSKQNTAMHASNQAVEAAKYLRGSGVRDVKTDILPVGSSADAGTLLVSYTKYSAHAPKDCSVMPGIENRGVETSYDYKQGCSIETYLARQVAKPKDLMGRGGVPATSSGRRAANMGSAHDYGVPNQPLEGESASGDN